MVSRSIPLHKGQGGMARASWDIALALQQSGVSIEVLTTPIPGAAASFIADGVRVRTVRGAAPARYSFRWWMGTALSRRTAGVTAVLSVSSGATAMVWLRRGPRYIFQLHGTSVQELGGALALRPRLWLLRSARLVYWCVVESLTFARATAVVAVSDELAGVLRRWPYRRAWRRTPLFVIPNPVDIDAFSSAASLRHATRARLGIPTSDLVAITASRLSRQKGVDRCLEALARSPDRVKLVIVGSGPEETALRQQARSLGVLDRVRFLGELDHADLPATLAAADVFVFPVRAFAREGLPLGVLEALAAGLRVIVPLNSTWPEDIRGRLDPVEVGDAKALARVLRTIAAQDLTRPSRLPSSYDVRAVTSAYRTLLLP